MPNNWALHHALPALIATAEAEPTPPPASLSADQQATWMALQHNERGLHATRQSLSVTVPELWARSCTANQQRTPLPPELSRIDGFFGRRKMQGYFRKIEILTDYAEVLHRANPVQTATLRESMGPSGAAFKLALPQTSDDRQKIPKPVFNAMVRRSLLDINFANVPANTFCVPCNRMADSQHAVTCKVGLLKGPIGVHDHAVRIFREIAKQAGVPVSPFEPRGLLPSASRPGEMSQGGPDILLDLDGPGHLATLADMTLVNACSPNNRRATSTAINGPGPCLKRAETAKCGKFMNRCRRARFTFIPLAITTSGTLGPSLLATLQTLDQRANSLPPLGSPFTIPTFFRYAAQALSLTVATGTMSHALDVAKRIALDPTNAAAQRSAIAARARTPATEQQGPSTRERPTADPSPTADPPHLSTPTATIRFCPPFYQSLATQGDNTADDYFGEEEEVPRPHTADQPTARTTTTPGEAPPSSVVPPIHGTAPTDTRPDAPPTPNLEITRATSRVRFAPPAVVTVTPSRPGNPGTAPSGNTRTTGTGNQIQRPLLPPIASHTARTPGPTTNPNNIPLGTPRGTRGRGGNTGPGTATRPVISRVPGTTTAAPGRARNPHPNAPPPSRTGADAEPLPRTARPDASTASSLPAGTRNSNATAPRSHPPAIAPPQPQRQPLRAPPAQGPPAPASTTPGTTSPRQVAGNPSPPIVNSQVVQHQPPSRHQRRSTETEDEARTRPQTGRPVTSLRPRAPHAHGHPPQTGSNHPRSTSVREVRDSPPPPQGKPPTRLPIAVAALT
jgi:hypothetical protein